MSPLELKRKDSILPINRKEDDLFICAASFEDRSRRASELLDPQYRTKQALVVFYKDTLNVKKGEKNLKYIDMCLKERASKIDGIICDFRNTYSLISELERRGNEGKLVLQGKFITIDISCFTKLHLLILLKYLSQRTRAVFRFVYTEPLTYSTMEGRNLSYGFLELVTVKYKISQTPKRRGSCYIFFIGHESARTYKVFELLEPERYWVVKGRPGYNLQLELFSEHENEFLIKKAEGLKTLKEASTKDPIDVMECLREISQEEKERSKDLVFIPCGTKLQTLGIFMFSQISQGFNLTISYPMPLRYEEKTYSTGSGKTLITFWNNIVQEEGYNLGLYSQIIPRRELYE